ncbi:hypothetical protein VTP01DRAFT_992 [Rhizomucor pusillus]|uniref:uncharacterized protein n=1 Tax=Rhizomucor pusillus TaxID=4840 RepID=UPI003744A14F
MSNSNKATSDHKQTNLGAFFSGNRKAAAVAPGEKRKRVIVESDEDEDEREEDMSTTGNTAPKKRKAEDDVLVKDENQDEDKEILEAEEDEQRQERELEEEHAAAKTMSVISTISEEAAQEMKWEKGKDVPYSILCKTFEKCESTTKRTTITENLVKLFVQVLKLSPKNLLETLYLCINKLGPDYEGLELGIGESLLMKAIAESTGRNMKQIKSDADKIGDLGTVAKESKSSQRTLYKPKPLTVSHVFRTFKEVAKITGQSAQKRKVEKIKGLLVACQDQEAKYLIRQLEGKLRIGMAEQTVLMALAHSAVLSKPESVKMSVQKREEELSKATDIIKSVYNQLPCYDMILPALLENPLEELLDKCKMRPGIPLKPMLAHPTKSLSEVLDRFEGHNFTCEFKYDGERAQIHRLEDGTLAVYSRNSENMSGRYPDVVEKLNKWLKPTTKSFIIDCEAVAWDREKKSILPFQILSTRKRKDVKEEDIKVQVAIYAFDCLYLNGESLLQKSLKERREKLKEAFQETENEFYFARNEDTNEIEKIQEFLDVSIANNCEGLMVKLYDDENATYEPSRRSRNWLKVKKDYLAGVSDSMDLVVIGAFYGRGKRTSVYGAFLLACYDPDTEEFQTVCKLGTGFSDEDLQNLYNSLKELEIKEPKRFYTLGDNPVKPDVWFEPKQVWEVRCADLSISPRYMAGVGMVDPSKGISLRFPRFIRVREDKDAEDATTSDQIVYFYNQQANVAQ